MGRAKNWTKEEIALACKAYAVATENSVSGCDIRGEDFNQNLVDIFKTFAPVPTPEDTYHFRKHVYVYLRDNVFGALQKFQKSIRKVEASSPSGVTEQQKINMAVAIHVGKTKKMDYDFKDFDASSWRLYLAWINVKFFPKFSTSESKVATPSNIGINGTVQEGDKPSPLSSGTSNSIYQKREKEGMLQKEKFH